MPSLPSELPAAIVERGRSFLNRAASITYDGTDHYLLGLLYYRVSFLRESPPSLIVPGDWTAIASPRALALLELLSRHPEDGSTR